jgi:hypothetical protein
VEAALSELFWLLVKQLPDAPSPKLLVSTCHSDNVILFLNVVLADIGDIIAYRHGLQFCAGK